MELAIFNKHLCKIINEYLSTKCLYLEELTEKTNDVYRATTYFIYYHEYKIGGYFRKQKCIPMNGTGYKHTRTNWYIYTF